MGEVDGLGEGLREVGHGTGGAGLEVAASDGGEEASESGGEVAGGEVVAGEEVFEVAGEFVGGEEASFFQGVVETEMRMAGGAGSAALAAVSKRETTQGHAVLWGDRGHGWLLMVDLDFG